MQNSFKKYITKTETETFIIEQDFPEVGWYLYRIDINGKKTHDYLQDSKQAVFEFAEQEFNVSPNLWNIYTAE